MEHQSFKINEEMQKYISSKIFPKIQFTIGIAYVRPIFGHRNNSAVNIWKQSTGTEMINGL